MPQNRIEIHQNLELDSSAGEPLLADLYLPTHVDIRPAVVLVFGGSWKSGDRSQQKVYGLALGKAGFVALATDHRYSTQAPWPAQLADVKTAIGWLRDRAAEFNIDPRRIAVSGNSSGGHLALMAGAEACVSAVCAFYPPTDLYALEKVIDDDSVRQLLGNPKDRESFERASPLTFANQSFPPTLLMHGSDDDRVPVEQSLVLKRALQDAGNQVELHLFDRRGHAFDADIEQARLASQIMIRFLRRYL